MKEKIFYEISAINIDDDKIIYKNYNSLMIHSGMGAMRFAGFRREISYSLQEDNITEIPNKLYEEKLVQSAKMKSEGLNDKDVIAFEESGYKAKDYNEFIKRKFLMETFKSNPEKYSLKIGDFSSFVYELQKILVKKGYNIPVDGLFKQTTIEALGAFEQKNGLFPDGKLDAVTLDYLLR